jgi:leader peptidase (prepilin peptidase)/N-methyltransferase
VIALCAAVTAVCCWPLAVVAGTVEPAASRGPDRTAAPVGWPAAGCAVALCLGALATIRLGATPPLPVALATIAAGTALAISDLRARRLPDLLISPILLVWSVTAATAVALHLPDSLTALIRAILTGAAIAGAAVLLAVARSGIGAGDIKLAAILSAVTAWLGLHHLAVFVLAGVGLTLATALIALIGTRSLRATIPAGPALCAAAVIAYLT